MPARSSRLLSVTLSLLLAACSSGGCGAADAGPVDGAPDTALEPDAGDRPRDAAVTRDSAAQDAARASDAAGVDASVAARDARPVDAADARVATATDAWVVDADVSPDNRAICDHPVVLDPTQGGYAELQAVAGPAEWVTSCATGADGGADALYTDTGGVQVVRLSLPAPERVRIRIASAWGAMIAVRGACSASAAEIACWLDVESGHSVEVDLPAGDSFVFVDPDVEAAFAISVEVACPDGQVFSPARGACVADPCEPNPCNGLHEHACTLSPDGGAACGCDIGTSAAAGDGGACAPLTNPTGASCADAILLEPGADRSITTTAVGHATMACDPAGSSGAAVYFGMTLAQKSYVRLYAQVDASNLFTDTVSVSLRRVCSDDTTEIACAFNDALSGGAALLGGELLAGSYGVVVSGVRTQPQTFVYSILPDPCATAPACAFGDPVPSDDQSSCLCVCPPGDIVVGTACVPSPCARGACPGATSRCLVDSASSYHCECPVGSTPADAGGACAPDPAAADWTLVVYEALDNNLGEGGGGPAASLPPSFGASTPVDVVWLSATPANDATLYHIGHGAGLATLAAWTDPDMGSGRTLTQLAVLAANYPAAHYALVIVDHGGDLGFAWDQGYDDWGAGPHLSNWISMASGSYASALAAMTGALGRPIDIVDFETCDLSTWEVADATQPYAGYLLASPVTAYSMNGGALASILAGAPTLSPSALGAAYLAPFTTSGGEIRTFTDLTRLDPVTAALTTLANAMLAHLDRCAEYDAMAPRFINNTDLPTFAQNLSGDPNLPSDVRDAATALSSTFSAALTVAPPGAYSLDVYLPPLILPAGTSAQDRALDPAYLGPGAVWVQASTWSSLLVACRSQ
jgi:hypothetical protein